MDLLLGHLLPGVLSHCATARSHRMVFGRASSAPQPEKLVELGSEASAHAAARKELTGGDRCAILLVAQWGAI